MRVFIFCVLACAFISPTFAKPAQNTIAIKKSDFVGTWQCRTEYEADGLPIVGNTLDTVNADGTMSQLWEIISYHNNKTLNSVEFMVVKNRWDYDKKGFKIYDWKLEDYQAYDDHKQPLGEEALLELKGFWQGLYDKPYQEKLAFTDATKSRFYYLDVPDDTKSAYCVRVNP